MLTLIGPPDGLRVEIIRKILGSFLLAWELLAENAPQLLEKTMRNAKAPSFRKKALAKIWRSGRHK
jgi:hypothetical protein